MKWTALFSVLLLISLISAEKARFDFYRVYDVTVNDHVALDLMKQIADYPDGVRTYHKQHACFIMILPSSSQYQFLSSPPAVVGVKSPLIVPPHKFGEWSDLIEKFNLDVKLLNNNLQEYISRLSYQFF
jgi:hypothetical protein